MILLQLYPEANLELVKAMLFHDCHERFVGDMPSNVLWSNADLAASFSRLCNQADEKLGLQFALTPIERNWLAACDKLELFMWAREQLALGNFRVNTMIDNLVVWFDKNAMNVPKLAWELFMTYEVRRMDD